MRARPVVRALLAVGAATVLAGCTGGDDPVAGSSPGGAPAATAPVSPEHGEADLAFVQQMQPHHEGALAMAELAPTRPGDPRVAALAGRIAAVQAPELQRLEALATAWRVELTGEAADGGAGETDDAAALQGLSGPEFDRQFLTRMVAHHEGALPLAREELARGRSPDARALATAVLAEQPAQVEEMQQLLTGL